MGSKNRDYLRIVMGVVIAVILGGMLIPFVRMLPTPAMMGVLQAPIYTICAYLTLESVRIKHAIILFGSLLGLILSIFMPYIFFVTVIPAILGHLFFEKSSGKAVVFASMQFNLMLPIIMPLDTPNFWLFSLFGFIASLILSILALVFAKQIKPRILKGQLANEEKN